MVDIRPMDGGPFYMEESHYARASDRELVMGKVLECKKILGCLAMEISNHLHNFSSSMMAFMFITSCNKEDGE